MWCTSNNFWTIAYPARLRSIGPERHLRRWRTYATAAIRNAVEARNVLMRQEA